MYEPQLRSAWDKSIKSIKYLEYSENYSVVHLHYDSPMFLIAERDLVDKYVNFYHDEVYYSWASSVSDDYFEPIKGVIRCYNYMNFFSLREDEEYFYFINFNQADIKVSSAFYLDANS
jgi:hypothetical protein